MAAPLAKWSSLAPMHVPRGSAPAITLDNKIYVFGGCGVNIANPLADAEMFDPTENKWVDLPKIPRARSNIALVAVGSKIALIGGYTVKGHPVTEVDVFDTTTQSWELFAPLKSKSTMYPIVLSVEKDIYVLGGANHLGAAITDCYILEEGADDWKTLPSLSTCRYHGKGFYFENKIVVVGGRSGKEAVTSVDTYNLIERSWNLKKSTPIPAKRVFSVPVRHKNHIYLLNGLVQPTDFKMNAERYDPKKKKWEMIKPSPFARADTAVCVMNDHIIIVSGMCEYGPNQVTELYDTNSGDWFTLPEVPSPRLSASAVVLGNLLITLGGIGLRGPSNAVEVLTFEEQ